MMSIKVFALAVYVERPEQARALVKPATAGGGALGVGWYTGSAAGR